MSVGWFASLFPRHRAHRRRRVRRNRSCSAEVIQRGQYLANVPFERVLEVAPVDQLGIKLPTRPNDGVVPGLPQDSRRRTVEADQFAASTAMTCRTAASTWDQPARQPNHSDNLLSRQPGCPQIGPPLHRTR